MLYRGNLDYFSDSVPACHVPVHHVTCMHACLLEYHVIYKLYAIYVLAYHVNYMSGMLPCTVLVLD